jgi:hypothetical protein
MKSVLSGVLRAPPASEALQRLSRGPHDLCPSLVFRLNDDNVKTVFFPFHLHPDGIIDMQVDPEGSGILAGRIIVRGTPQMPIMHVLVDDFPDLDPVAPQPPANGGGISMRCGVDPNFPPALMQSAH